MSENDGGPAFPVTLQNIQEDCYGPTVGMSLRDYFAGQALAGMCANPRTAYKYEDIPYPLAEKRIAKAAYSFADKMLATREKTDE